MQFPLIVRPRGSHAGVGLAKTRRPRRDRTISRRARPEQEFFVSRFVDYANEDGLFRKYRLVFVDGRPYACHMAIADRWDIWYLNAGMSDSAPKRLEEETFMRTFDIGFARRHQTALAGMAERIGLDYFTIDCAENKRGELLIFEADNTAVVHNMDSPELFPYKPPQMREIFEAFAAMLYRRARGRPGARGVTKALREALLRHRESSETLDPQDWDEIRAQGHRMLDDMFDYAADIRDRPVWQPIPDEVRARFRENLPREPSDLGEVYREFADFIVPYATGNVHPGFMGWVHGGGTAVGMLAEMLAAGLNANLGGRDHIPIEVERQIVEWTRQMFGFPDGRQRDFRHRHVDGQSDGGAGGANGGARTDRSGSTASATTARGLRPIPRRRRTAASPRPWISPASAATRCAASRSIDRTASTSPRCASGSRGPRRRPETFPGGRLGRNGGYRRDRRSRRRWARCAANRGCGFTSTAPMARSGFFRRRSRRGSPDIENADSIALRFPQMGAGAL